MTCEKCKKEIVGGNKFCNYCGNKVQTEEKPVSTKEEGQPSLDKSLILKVSSAIFGIFILYIIFADKPFFFYRVRDMLITELLQVLS